MRRENNNKNKKYQNSFNIINLDDFAGEPRLLGLIQI